MYGVCCCLSQCHVFLWLSNSLRGWDSSAGFGENLSKWLVIPRNQRSSVKFVGGGIALMVAVFLGSAEIPWASTTCPRNVILVCLNKHLSLLRVTFALSSRLSTSCNLVSCSFSVLPNTSTSSIKHTTLGSPLTIWDILLWKISGAQVIPNGSLLNIYCPNGVMKAVKGQDCMAKGICQNPLLASNLLKVVAPDSWAKVSSTLGKG